MIHSQSPLVGSKTEGSRSTKGDVPVDWALVLAFSGCMVLFEHYEAVQLQAAPPSLVTNTLVQRVLEGSLDDPGDVLVSPTAWADMPAL